MKMKSCDQATAGGLATLLTRRAPEAAEAEPASGIQVVELSAEEIERVSGGLAMAMARGGTTCSPCADDCGY